MNATDFLKSRGWVKGAGPNFYFDGSGTSQHPHLHLGLSRVGYDNVGRGDTHSNTKLAYGNLKVKVDFLAWSNGHQGINYIRNGAICPGVWKKAGEDIIGAARSGSSDETLSTVLCELDYLFGAFDLSVV